MFVDRMTLDAELARNSSLKGRRLGTWRLVVVEHLPYTDMRLSGVVSTQILSSRLYEHYADMHLPGAVSAQSVAPDHLQI